VSRVPDKVDFVPEFFTKKSRRTFISQVRDEKNLVKFLTVTGSVISVQQFIFILVFIQFSVNHFYFYSLLVLSTLILFSSYSVLVLDKPNL